MAVATFDTLKFANTLKAAGVPEKQAEAQAVAFAEVVQVNFKELVTKDDLVKGLREVEQNLNAKIDNSASEIQVQIAHVKGEQILLRWMMGATFAGVIAALGLLGRLLFVMPR